MSTTTAATKNALSLSPAPGDPGHLPIGAAKAPRLINRKAGWVAGGALLVVVAAAAGVAGYRTNDASQPATAIAGKSTSAAAGDSTLPTVVPTDSLAREAAPVGHAHAINLPPTVVTTASSTPRLAMSPTGHAHAINLPPTVVTTASSTPRLAKSPTGHAHAINLPPTVVVVAQAPTDAIDLPVGHAHAINLR